MVNVAFYAFVTLQSSAYHLLGNLIISPVRRQSPPRKKRKKHKRKAFFNEPLPTLKRKSGDMSGLPWISLDFVPTCFCCLYCTPYFVFFVFSEVSPWSPLFDDSAHLWMDLLSAQGFFIRIFFFFFQKDTYGSRRCRSCYTHFFGERKPPATVCQTISMAAAMKG